MSDQPAHDWILRILAGVSIAALALPLGACGDSDTSTTGGALAARECDSVADCGRISPTECQRAACSDTGQCVVEHVAVGTACDDANACTAGETCNEGTCGGGSVVPAVCGERVCGQDACSNSCGSCGEFELCNDAGQCELGFEGCGPITNDGCCTGDGRVKWCDSGTLREQTCNGTCGWLAGGEDYYWCVSQGEPAPQASLPYLCPGEACPANGCKNRECGFVCGEECGTCAAGEKCDADGTCVEDQCGDLTFVGCCAGSVSTWCQDDEVRTQNCDADGCGWVVDTGDGGDFYDCGGDGPDPTGAAPLSCDDVDFPKTPSLP